MTEFILFCLATVGMTSIIVQGAIFMPFRQFIGNWAENAALQREKHEQDTGVRRRRALIEWFSDLINCAQCTGFWCGLFCGYFFFSSGFDYININKGNFVDVDELRELKERLQYSRIILVFCCGLAGSYLSAFGCNAVDWIFYRKMNALRQLEEQDLILADHRAHFAAHHHEHDHQEPHHQEDDHDH